MNNGFPSVSLGEVLTKSKEQIEIDPHQRYKQVTIKLWGQGVVLRDEVAGVDIAGAKRFVVRPQQFILSRIDARNGAFGLVPDSLDGAVVSNDFPAFTPNPSRILPTFLGWMSKTHSFIDLCRAASEGTTNRVRLKEDRFMATKIPLPPLPEQRRTVARIEELAARIEEARGLRRETNTEIQAMLLGAYRRIVEGARRMPMSEVAPLQRRSVLVEPHGSYPELGVRSFGRGTFHKPSLSGLDVGSKKLFRIEAGDLLFNIVFAWEGAVAIAHPEDHGRVGSHRFLTCVPEPGLATSAFLRFHFLTDEGLDQLGKASPGGAGRNRTLGQKALRQIEVPLPSYEDQQWFSSLNEKVDSLRACQHDADVELTALLPSVLNRAFKEKL